MRVYRSYVTTDSCAEVDGLGIQRSASGAVCMRSNMRVVAHANDRLIGRREGHAFLASVHVQVGGPPVKAHCSIQSTSSCCSQWRESVDSGWAHIVERPGRCNKVIRHESHSPEVFHDLDRLRRNGRLGAQLVCDHIDSGEQPST
jgi:hypothetical protein